jgi:Fe-S oxidoreductase/nitrate reductase gamma subunit
LIPSREIFWNVGSQQGAVYLVALMSVAIASIGLLQHIKGWRKGRKEKIFDQAGNRLKYFFRFLLSHERIRKDTYAGVMHLFIFWGFVVLFLGTLIIAFQEDLLLPFFGRKVLEGNFYLIYSLVLDLFGLLAIVGVGLALYRRYVLQPEKLDNKPSDLILLCLILFILVSGFCVEGFRLNVSNPQWALWEPVGWLFGTIFNVLGIATSTQRGLHKIIWWLHLIASMGLIAYFPFSNLFHVVSSSLNVFFRSLKPSGALVPIDIQEGEQFGVAHIQDFTWKDLLDLDACTRCGRCQENCPAAISGKPLNPKKVIQDLRTFLQPFSHNGVPLVSNIVSEAELWACTTCRACMEVCPVFVEHLNKIIEMRRHSVLTESKFPSEYKQVFKNLEIFGDTLGKGKLFREDWASNLTIDRVYQQNDTGLLFWVGCMSALYDERSKNTPIAAAKILEKAGLDFGILGEEELCCGDAARRMGNEYLFQHLAKKNIEVFRKYKIKKVVTHCPHCFNTFKNEYAQFGADIEVVHFMELIVTLLREGKLNVKSKIDDIFTYHDPCYLGRHNSIYMEPREILGLILNSDMKEMDSFRDKSFCCGAGGGNMWRAAVTGRRIEGLRVEEAVKTDASGIITSCPFCEIMFDSAVKQKGLEYSFRLMDIIELVNRVT